MIPFVSLFPDRRLHRRSATRLTVSQRPIDGGPSAIKALPPLLHAASELELDDTAGWASLGVATRRVIDGLIHTGELSWRLRLEPGAPPMVVAKTLEVAWRQVTARAGQSHHRM